ncbi:N-acetylglucosamine kinase [Oceaniglobus trochenteri]|uniref:N-acetylglucosamine kinase n=1 Tax=Oceaniglobus trochenteri TaxID=2763260 RepID=UPI001CFF5DCC|nr:BadF/BadG/BcrA/BcrD ATPase family protein [Oceaniglobus trochenteri]
MTLHLGVDMGGTASRWVVCDDNGSELARGAAEGGSGLIFDAASMASFAGALEAIRDAMPGAAATAHFGITGAGFLPHPRIESQVEAVFGLPRDSYSYSNDMVLAWHAAFGAPDGPGRGYLISSGTGSIGISIEEDGTPTIVGGRGIMIDDGGSGSWIALRALDRLFRVIDESGTPEGAEILARHLFAATGGSGRDAINAYVYGRGRGHVGQLAQAVAAAAHEGDALALGIIEEAGAELVRLARALIGRGGAAPVSFIGGVLGLHPAIRARIERDMADHPPTFPRIDAAAQAALMASKIGLPQ